MDSEKIGRINELARKKRGLGLSADELLEQAALRREYLDEIRAGLRAQLECIHVEQEDGHYEKLGKKTRNG